MGYVLNSRRGVPYGITAQLVLEFKLAFYQWAIREIDPLHPDVGHVVLRLRDLQDTKSFITQGKFK